jgi:hypothetical protein
MGAIEHPNILTHTADFTSIGIASLGGWVAFGPIDALMAPTDGKDKPGAPRPRPLRAGHVPICHFFAKWH